jgi:transposase, IS5 family
MVRRRERQRSVWEVVLPDASKLWPADLRRIDTLLEDAAVLDPIVMALEARWAQSRRRGRPGTPAEVVLRMLVLKHLYRWSYDTLEHEVRANLVYRAFARVGVGPVPDAKTILKIARGLDPAVIQQVHDRIVALAVERKVTRGRRLRVDTTVIETNAHYPTDSTLLRDSVRVLTRTMQRAGAVLGGAAAQIRNRLRSVGRQVLAIAKTARRGDDTARPRIYRRLMATTRAVLRDADTMVRRIGQRVRTAAPAARRVLQRARATLDQMRPLARRVLAQTRARVLGGDTHVPDKVLSIFEPHTEAIRKGKLIKPTEFGKLVTIQEAEGQIVSAYEVHAKRPADRTLWVRALDAHQQQFGRAPDLATADRGYSSAANEAAATARGVRRVVLPKLGPKSPARRTHEAQRWFRRGLRWRVGCEGRISVLKRRHDLQRCRYHGADGMARALGLGVIASNLLSIAAQADRRARAAA